MYWNTPAILKSSCKIDVSFFPFDTQACAMKFGSWSYSGAMIDFDNTSAYGDISAYTDNGEWNLNAMNVKKNVVYYQCCKDPYPDITFTIIINRRPLFYVFNVIIPCMLLSLVTSFTFLLPADSGEKISFVLTSLLSLIVFLLLVAETIPASSEQVPLIGELIWCKGMIG